jgi:hypothetical protein
MKPNLNHFADWSAHALTSPVVMLLTMALVGAAIKGRVLLQVTAFTDVLQSTAPALRRPDPGLCGLTLVEHLVAGVRVEALDTIAVEVAGAQALEVQVVGPCVRARAGNVKLGDPASSDATGVNLTWYCVNHARTAELHDGSSCMPTAGGVQASWQLHARPT